MKRYQLSKAGVNANEGIARFGGNAEMYEKMLLRFPADPCFGQLTQAMQEGDAQAAFRAAHSLKGVSGNMSMTRLYEDICPLVELLRAGSTDGAEPLMAKITEDYNAVLEAI